MHRAPIVLAALVATAVVVVLGIWLLDDNDAPTASSETYAATPLRDIDTLTITVARANFCDRVDPRAIEAGLEAEPTSNLSYQNGDQVALADGLTDVAHEYGCNWTAANGVEANAWVFAPPVDEGRARRLIKTAAKAEDCTSTATPAFGAPSVGLLCSGSEQTASYRGLFGDAWLTCELLVPGPGTDADRLRARADAWCGAVAGAASAGG